MSDSIIVYRNPMEKAFWESMQNGNFIYIAAFVVVSAVVFLVVYLSLIKICKKIGWRDCDTVCGLIAIVAAGAAAFFTIIHI